MKVNKTFFRSQAQQQALATEMEKVLNGVVFTLGWLILLSDHRHHPFDEEKNHRRNLCDKTTVQMSLREIQVGE
jgi:hypothetical protein